MSFFSEWRRPGAPEPIADRISAIPGRLADRVIDAWRGVVDVATLGASAARAPFATRRSWLDDVLSVFPWFRQSRSDRLRAEAAAGLADARARLDALMRESERLGAAALRSGRAYVAPRQRSWFERLISPPTMSERASEAARATLADLEARAQLLRAEAERLGRSAYDAGRAQLQPRRRSLFERLFLPAPRRPLERAGDAAAAAGTEIWSRLSSLQQQARALGDHRLTRDARHALDRASRLRLTVAPDPAEAQMLPRLSTRGSGGLLAHAATALAAFAAISIAQAVLEERKSRSGLGASNDAGAVTSAARGLAAGRGRTARSPWEIPWAGWKDIGWRVWREVGEDRLMAIAAGVVFFGLLAIFPAITALVSSYGLFASPATISEHLSFLAGAMPSGSFSIVQDQINRVVANGEVALGFKFAFGLALAVWSANAGMKAILDALNVVYEEDEKRSFFKLNLVSLLFTVGALGGVLIGVAGVVGVPVVLNAVGLGAQTEWLLSALRWPVLFALLVTALSVLYRYGPSRREPRWQWVSVGSVLGALLWIVGSAALSFYISRFGNYDATYGSLGAAIGLMMWMWLSAIVVLLGAEINAEVEHQTTVDSTDGVAKPLGARGARMADSVGEASS